MFEWRWLEPELVPAVPRLEYSTDSRQLLDRLVLKLVRTGDVQAAQGLKQMSLGLSQAHDTVEARTFWKIAAGVCEALAEGLLRVDVYTKRAVLRIVISTRRWRAVSRRFPTVSRKTCFFFARRRS